MDLKTTSQVVTSNTLMTGCGYSDYFRTVLNLTRVNHEWVLAHFVQINYISTLSLAQVVPAYHIHRAGA